VEKAKKETASNPTLNKQTERTKQKARGLIIFSAGNGFDIGLYNINMCQAELRFSRIINIFARELSIRK